MRCEEKKRYDTKEHAKRFARRGRQRGFAKARPYHCPECGLWHLSTADAASRAFHRRGERSMNGGSDAA